MSAGIKMLLRLLAAFGLMLAGPLTAQTFTTIHDFSNSDGAYPYAGLILYGNALFGMAGFGGSAGNGTVFAVNTDGSGFTNLHSFNDAIPYHANGTELFSTNSDGAHPYAGLILSGNALFGTAGYGGSAGNGTVFAVNTDGSGFTNLHSFNDAILYYTNLIVIFYTNSDGGNPLGGLLLSGNTLYGTASGGGNWANGTVFEVNTDGSGFAKLHSFTEGFGDFPFIVNNDGASPRGLTLLGNTLYGTAASGGSSGYGTVFKLNTNGTGFTTLHSFTPPSKDYPYTNSDGNYPQAGLLLSGNTLYGTASGGGRWGNGTVFAINTDGSGFTNLYSFAGSDGASPQAALILSGNTLYGTKVGGGSSGDGTLFALNADGTGFRSLYSFTARSKNSLGVLTNSDGASPYAGLIFSGNALYGTATSGGTLGFGTVFRISLPPQLTLTPLGKNLVLSWPTNFTGFGLQSTTNFASPVWTTNLPGPVVVTGQYTVTNPISDTQQFFRLSQ
jgi:uncharacterized repeat protein (TIGR03803 family)